MSDRNILIVGGSHGIGLGIVKRLAAVDRAVTVISRTWDSSGELPKVKHIQLDVVNDEINPSVLPDRGSDPARVHAIGILLGDKQAGTFEIIVDWIKVIPAAK